MNSYITFHCGFELCCIEMCGTYHMSLILKMYVNTFSGTQGKCAVNVMSCEISDTQRK